VFEFDLTLGPLRIRFVLATPERDDTAGEYVDLITETELAPDEDDDTGDPDDDADRIGFRAPRNT
jgi:hypothetical protein